MGEIKEWSSDNPETEKPPEFFVGMKTSASERHPELNEDSILLNIKKKIFGIFDGVGGGPAGEIASRLAKECVEEELGKLPKTTSLKNIEKKFISALKKADKAIFSRGKKNVEEKNMGTTASVVKIVENKDGITKAVIGNVGDSRVYLIKNDGQLVQITLDDGILRDYVKNEDEARVIQDKLSDVDSDDKFNSLTYLEKNFFIRRREIRQGLGYKKVEPRIHITDIFRGDRIIIVSDGVSDNLTNEEIKEILINNRENQIAAKILVEAAQFRSRESDSSGQGKRHIRAKKDDMSAIVLGYI